MGIKYCADHPEEKVYKIGRDTKDNPVYRCRECKNLLSEADVIEKQGELEEKLEIVEDSD